MKGLGYLAACAVTLTGCSILFNVGDGDGAGGASDSGPIRDGGANGDGGGNATDAGGRADATLPDLCYKLDPGCPDGWFSAPGSCSCYSPDFRTTPSSAEQLCQDMAPNSHLVVIENVNEDELFGQGVINGGGSDFFIGLFLDVDQEWKWDTGELLRDTMYHNFPGGIPPVDDGKPCVQIDLDLGGAWKNTSCAENDILCELDDKSFAVSPPPP